MIPSTRLFRSPWTYFAWLAFVLFQIWHELHPLAHAVPDPWPTWDAATYAIGSAFCISFARSLARLTPHFLERIALVLFIMTFATSLGIQIHTLAHLQTSLPSFRPIFLAANSLLAGLTAIRLLQVFREPPMPGLLSRATTPNP